MREWNKELKYMDIVFENCESFSVYPECIEWFCVSGFENTVMFQSPASVFGSSRAKSVKIHLSNLDKIKPNEIFSRSFTERVKQYGDICFIKLNYTNGEEDGFYVPWDNFDRQSNSFQEVSFEDGIMIIEIVGKEND